MECIRERDLRTAAENRIKEIREEASKESSRLSSLIDGLRGENTNLLSENMTQKNLCSKLENDLSQCNSANSVAMRELQLQCNDLRNQCSESEDSLRRSKDEMLRQSARAAGLEERIEIMKAQQDQELELHKAAVEAIQITSQEDKAIHQHNRQSELLQKISQVEDERDQIFADLQDYKMQLEEQYTEANALRLRLQLQETQFSQSQRQKSIQRKVQQSASGLGSSTERDMVQSPLFSEDYGPVSIPNSPMVSNQLDSSLGFEHSRPRHVEAFYPAHGQLHHSQHGKDAAELKERQIAVERLENENSRLKDMIHQVNIGSHYNFILP